MDEPSPSREPLAWSIRRAKARPWLTLPLVGLTALLTIVLLLSMGPGDVHLSPLQTLAALLQKIHMALPVDYTEQQAAVLWTLRLPRALTAMLVGACLSAAGAMMQGLFRSPLADPGLVGGTGGAATAAVGLMAMMHLSLDTWTGRISVLLAALLGAAAALGGVYRLSEVRGKSTISNMLLAGFALQGVSFAVVALLSFVARDARLHDLGRWTLGDLGHTSWETLGATLPYFLAFAVLAAWLVPALDAVLLGEAEATHLGYNISRVRLIGGAAMALALAAAVTAGGTVAFVGLLVPHLARQLVGSGHRFLILGSALLGGAVLLAADLVARSLAPPAEVPVGILTVLCGAPFFLWLLAQERRRGGA